MSDRNADGRNGVRLKKGVTWDGIRNWWYYYKWYVVCGVILLVILIQLVGSYLGIWETKPDVQIAYVGEAALPEDTAAAIEKAFSELADDYNGDGEVVVKVNQYVSDPDAVDSFGADAPLIGDIEGCDSYFFLMEDPESFQKGYEILAEPDGSCPEEGDDSVEGKAAAWEDCPGLADIDLGSYTDSLLGQEISGENRDLVSGLFLGRRCFYGDRTTPYVEQCGELWDRIVNG